MNHIIQYDETLKKSHNKIRFNKSFAYLPEIFIQFEYVSQGYEVVNKLGHFIERLMFLTVTEY